MSDARSNSYAIISHNRPFKVVVCIVTLVAFLFNIVSYDLAWAAGTPSELTSVGSDRAGIPGAFKELNPVTFALPQHLGTIKDSYLSQRRKPGSENRTIIHIQDAHCNYYAQHRIAEIIEYLNKVYGVNTINLEGGVRDYDLSIFTNIKDKVKRERTADYFVKEGVVNGAEYFAINNPEKVTLWGIEDVKLYIDNLKTYRNSLKYKDEVDKYLKNLSHILSNLKLKIYSKELLELDSRYNAYKVNNADFKDYLSYLMRKAKERLIDIKSYTNIYLLSQTLGQESGIDFRKANNERDELIDKLGKRLSKNALEELVLKIVEFKSERISQADLYQYLANKAKSISLKLDDFPELAKYSVYVATYQAIDKSKIMDEVGNLEDKLKASLFTNDKDRQLDVLPKNLALMKNMFNISLTREDYKYYQANERSFEIRNFSKFIEREAPLYKIQAKLDNDIAKLDDYREDMCKFYEYSFKRDAAFLKNINLKKTSIIVTGGFHTENLCDIFKKQGISYVSIIPNFKNCDGYTCPYFKILSGGGKINFAETQKVLDKALAIPDPLNPVITKAVKDEFGEAIGLGLEQPAAPSAAVAPASPAPINITSGAQADVMIFDYLVLKIPRQGDGYIVSDEGLLFTRDKKLLRVFYKKAEEHLGDLLIPFIITGEDNIIQERVENFAEPYLEEMAARYKNSGEKATVIKELKSFTEKYTELRRNVAERGIFPAGDIVKIDSVAVCKDAKGGYTLKIADCGFCYDYNEETLGQKNRGKREMALRSLMNYRDLLERLFDLDAANDFVESSGFEFNEIGGRYYFKGVSGITFDRQNRRTRYKTIAEENFYSKWTEIFKPGQSKGSPFDKSAITKSPSYNEITMYLDSIKAMSSTTPPPAAGSSSKAYRELAGEFGGVISEYTSGNPNTAGWYKEYCDVPIENVDDFFYKVAEAEDGFAIFGGSDLTQIMLGLAKRVFVTSEDRVSAEVNVVRPKDKAGSEGWLSYEVNADRWGSRSENMKVAVDVNPEASIDLESFVTNAANGDSLIKGRPALNVPLKHAAFAAILSKNGMRAVRLYFRTPEDRKNYLRQNPLFVLPDTSSEWGSAIPSADQRANVRIKRQVINALQYSAILYARSKGFYEKNKARAGAKKWSFEIESLRKLQSLYTALTDHEKRELRDYAINMLNGEKESVTALDSVLQEFGESPSLAPSAAAKPAVTAKLPGNGARIVENPGPGREIFFDGGYQDIVKDIWQKTEKVLALAPGRFKDMPKVRIVAHSAPGGGRFFISDSGRADVEAFEEYDESENVLKIHVTEAHWDRELSRGRVDMLKQIIAHGIAEKILAEEILIPAPNNLIGKDEAHSYAVDFEKQFASPESLALNMSDRIK
ncbi:MAG: hypothetical protein WC738_00250, partial [Candidatus Omnitrophota bacterium]